MDLEDLRKEVLTANLPLSENNLVFGKGNSIADIMFIGEAPGAKEDKLGEPFVGAAGKELDKLLESVGLSIDDIYITNILKYRPENNRNPTLLEIETHTPFLLKQIEIIKPKIICTLGNYASKFVLSCFNVKKMKKVEGISKIHGKLQEISYDKITVKVLPLYHPAAMLYNPKLRSVLKNDFLLLKKLI